MSTVIVFPTLVVKVGNCAVGGIKAGGESEAADLHGSVNPQVREGDETRGGEGRSARHRLCHLRHDLQVSRCEWTEELHSPLRHSVVLPVGQLRLVDSLGASDIKADLVTGRVRTLFICNCDVTPPSNSGRGLTVARATGLSCSRHGVDSGPHHGHGEQLVNVGGTEAPLLQQGGRHLPLHPVLPAGGALQLPHVLESHQ